MTEEARKERVRRHWAKAQRERAAATRNADAGDYGTAATRLYVAAMHAARALLTTRDLEPKTHRGIKHMLIIHFVAQGILSSRAEPAYSRLETERDLADYAADFEVSQERYALCRDEADALMAEAHTLLLKEGWLGN